MTRDRTSPVFFVSMQSNGGWIDFPYHVLSLVVEDDEKKADTLKITIDNSDLSAFDDPVFDKTITLRVRWGYPNDLSAEHTAIVQKVTGARVLELECLDKGVVGNKEAKTRVFERVTRSQVAEAIAVELGYTAAQRFIQPTTIVHETIAQAGMTDLQFAKKLATLEGFEFFVSRGNFHWEERRFGDEPIRVLSYFLPPNVGDVIDFKLEDDLVGRKGKTTAIGRDPVTKTQIGGVGSVADTERAKLGTVPAAPDASTAAPAAGVLTFDPVTNQTVITYPPPGKPVPSAGSAQNVTTATTATSSAAAKAEADAAFKRSARAAIKLTVDCVGDPGLVAKTVVRIEGLGARLSGNYYVTKAVHTHGPGSYRTTISVRRDAHGKASSGPKPPAADKGAENAKPAADAGVLQPKLTFDPVTNEPVYTYGTGKK